jgi:hypothetical protein
MIRALDHAVDDHAVGEIGMLVGADILRGIILPVGPIHRDCELADPTLLDVLILEIGGEAGEVPFLP